MASKQHLPLLCSFLWIAGSLGLQQQGSSSSLLNVEELKKTIYSGRVYQQSHFLTEDQVQQVLIEVDDLELKGGFERKGLSSTAQKNQTFDKTLDRSICPVPWFLRALEGTDTRDIPARIQQMQLTLSQVLSRPTLADTSLNHECYYSKSEVGSRLPRHMDERHEETKGAKGWLSPSRRSLSWLIYLSDPQDWSLETHGGALRSYPQRYVVEADSTHEGNLQVGWLASGDKDNMVPSRPVYLDSWHPVMGVVVEGAAPEPHCILYTLDETTGEQQQQQQQRQILTRPWLTEQLRGMPMPDFLKTAAQHDAANTDQPVLFTGTEYAKRFAPLEDRVAWDAGTDPVGSEVVDVLPERGSLVVFDSVKLPHQVQLIHEGRRLALAGWFHEKTQEFPETFYGTA